MLASPMTYANITIASHHFALNQIQPRMRAVTKEMSQALRLTASSFVNKRGQRIKSGKDKYFFAYTESRGEIRYHINHLEDFKKALYRHQLDTNGLVTWKTLPTYAPTKINLTIKPHFIPNEDQKEAVEYIIDGSRPNNKAVIMQAGGGKTLTAMIAAAKQGELIAIVLEPKYIDQWLNAFEENCIINPKRICVIGADEKKNYKTSDKLKSLINMAFDGPLPYDAVIISSTTFRNYIEAYEQWGSADELERNEGYGVPPYQFFEHLRVGLRIIDEAHENFHFVFRLDLYTHVKNSVALSATLFADPKQVFMNEQILRAYPKHLRFDKGGFNKYVTAYSLHFSLRNPREIRVMGSMGYSHIEFEKSIMKVRNRLDCYFHMTRESMRYTYDLEYRPGDRCLVYFASIEMCTLFTEYIQREYPHLNVKRFVEDDPLENLLTADISVSTVRSAGTGKDIQQLTTVIMTPAINSSPTNIQGFGRLRDLNRKDPKLGRKMFFVYFCGDDFERHVDYHMNKKELLRTRAKSYEPRFYGTMF